MTFKYDIASNEQDRITFDYDVEARERLDTKIEGDSLFVFANREGMISLAKMLLKMAHGSYSNGFHVHVRRDFNANDPQVLTVVLSNDDQ